MNQLIRFGIPVFQAFTELWTNLFSLPIIGDLFLFDGLDILLSVILAFWGN